MKLTEATTPTGLSQSTGREATAPERQQQGLIDNNSHMPEGYLGFKHETYRPVVAVKASQSSVCFAAEADIGVGLLEGKYRPKADNCVATPKSGIAGHIAVFIIRAYFKGVKP
jgi:hypothetical protein